MENIKKVYDKFNHFDKILSDKRLNIDDENEPHLRNIVLYELWDAIKKDLGKDFEPIKCPICNGNGLIPGGTIPISAKVTGKCNTCIDGTIWRKNELRK